ncbi:MAG: amidohydrolase family protein, partial [Rhodospirillales bacterium]
TLFRSGGFHRSIDRIKEYGWHAKIHSAGDEWLELTDLLAKVTIPVVIDHMGHPELGKGLNQPSIKMILNLLRKENWWIMVSNGDRVSAEEHGWSDALPFARMLIEAAPGRSIWCTDWPHVQYTKPMPNDAELVEFLYQVAPDPVQRQNILVDNPARLLAF